MEFTEDQLEMLIPGIELMDAPTYARSVQRAIRLGLDVTKIRTKLEIGKHALEVPITESRKVIEIDDCKKTVRLLTGEWKCNTVTDPGLTLVSAWTFAEFSELDLSTIGI